MNNWRDAILSEFVQGVNKLTLVADPDNLLTEEKLASAIRERGFDLIEFDDPIEFRFAYESKYRSIWDHGELTDLVVILHLRSLDLESLPFDLLQSGRKLSFNLGLLFPNLSYPVIEKLDRSLLDSLFEAQIKSPPDRLSDNATKDFILRHVYGIAAEVIFDDVQLLKTLIGLHYGSKLIPYLMTERIVEVLRGQTNFGTWPLKEIVNDSAQFFEFLQERWPIFLRQMSSTNMVDQSTDESLKYSGPDILPFGHDSIRVYVDNLFIEGKLSPIEISDLSIKSNHWIRCGIIEPNTDNQEVRITRLFKRIEESLPTTDYTFSDWTAFSLKWAELTALVHKDGDSSEKIKLGEMGDAVNGTFASWLDKHYADLITQSPKIPAMVHHIPRRLARELDGAESPALALIVVDGLSLDQWITIRQTMQKQVSDIVMRESAVFAWIPTLTSVSRQAIFSGKAPMYFPASINSTNSEEVLWKQFWETNGVPRLDIVYKRGVSEEPISELLESTILPGKTKVIGFVVDKIDKIMHGMQLGSAGMHNQITQWCQAGFLNRLITQLLDAKFEVWLTSDHGNIECRGVGRPSEGVIAETRGERARVYPTLELRSQVASAFSSSREWQPIGLPPNYFPLVASNRDAFVHTRSSTVAHGGVAIEEVIVPLVRFERRTR